MNAAINMCETLDDIRDLLAPVRKYGHPEAGDKDPGAMFALAETIGKKIDGVRSIPLRNCDCFRTWEDAYLYWSAAVQEVDGFFTDDLGYTTRECVEKLWPHFTNDKNREFLDWFTAEAEDLEEEGETK